MPDEAASKSIRAHYVEQGAEAYYALHGSSYRNPHELRLQQALAEMLHRRALPSSSPVLDLACGSGEVTLALRDRGFTNVTGVDPYTGEAYRRRTGQPARAESFATIAQGALQADRYHLIVCSYALHLITPSRLPELAVQLALCSKSLLVLTPHKRPQIGSAWGWQGVEEITVQRVRARWYQSLLFTAER